jgi:hypothetical protein
MEGASREARRSTRIPGPSGPADSERHEIATAAIGVGAVQIPGSANGASSKTIRRKNNHAPPTRFKSHS